MKEFLELHRTNCLHELTCCGHNNSMHQRMENDFFVCLVCFQMKISAREHAIIMTISCTAPSLLLSHSIIKKSLKIINYKINFNIDADAIQ